jgi:hypothetical protein
MMTRMRKWTHGRNRRRKQRRMVVRRIRNWWKGSGKQAKTLFTQITGHSVPHVVWLQDRTNKNLPQYHFFQIWLSMVKAA